MQQWLTLLSVGWVQLQELPAKSMYVGKTHLKMNDIRSFNQLQQQIYRLHHNDCRHARWPVRLGSFGHLAYGKPLLACQCSVFDIPWFGSGVRTRISVHDVLLGGQCTP